MTTEYHGAILLLNSTPNDETTDSIAKDVAEVHFPEYSYRYRLTNSLPEGTPVDLADQYTASLRDLPTGATYLLVYPVEDSNSNT
jgi:hypothetical protein